MAGSWRDILDGANASPPMDRGGVRPGPVLHRPVSQAPQQRPHGHPYSAAEARGLLERELAAVSGRPLGDGPAPALGRPVEHRLAAAPVRQADAGQAPAPRMRVEHRLPAATVRPAEHRPAAVPVRPADVRPVAPPYVTPARARAVEHGPAPALVPAAPMEHSPAPATLTEYWLATGGRAPAAMAGKAPHTEEKIPYNSLMDALGRATPAMLTEAEKAGLPVPVPAIRSPKINSFAEQAPVARSSRSFRAGPNRRLIGLRALEPRRKRRWRKPGRTNRVRGRCRRRLGGHPFAVAAAGGASGPAKPRP